MYSINSASNVKSYYNSVSHVSISLQIDGVATTVKLPEILTNIELYKYILTRKCGTQYNIDYTAYKLSMQDSVAAGLTDIDYDDCKIETSTLNNAKIFITEEY